MNKPTIDEILAPKPEARPRIYAYSIDDAAPPHVSDRFAHVAGFR